MYIGECMCLVKGPLGTGSFGTVWAAELPAGLPLAIKEILCSSQADLLNALFEGHLLRTFGGTIEGRVENQTSFLTGAPAPTRACAKVLPSLVACETTQLEPEAWRIRLAMTRVSGEPLDCFLKQRWQQVGAGGAHSSRLTQQLMEACHFARQLLIQLAPAFEHISTLAYHRDVNAHNILIDRIDQPLPRFGLIDFGLAVDVFCWQRDLESSSTSARPSRVGQDGASTWHHLDVGGDCRYWPVSAWVQFLLGWTELEANPCWSFEYQTQLDLHSLGLTALQVLAEMLPLPPEDVGHLGLHSGAPLLEVCVLRLEWERYWTMVTPLHARLMDTFHNGGDWDKLKTDCLETRVHDTIAMRLGALRAALAAAEEACRRTRFDASLFSALLLLISSGDSEHWAQGPPRWRQVSLTLGSSADDRESNGEHDYDAGDDAQLNLHNAGSAGLRSSCGSANYASTISTASSLNRQAEAMRLPEPMSCRDSSIAARTCDSLPGRDPHGNDLMLKLGHLKDKVEWLRQEMSRLSDKGEGGSSKQQMVASMLQQSQAESLLRRGEDILFD